MKPSLVCPVIAVLACGCGAAPAAASRSVALLVEEETEPVLLPGPASVESEIGGMSQYGVEKRLAELHPRFIGCVERASERLSSIGGRVNVRMRVDRSGGVRWAYLSDTTLGDREAESCVLELVKSRRWPRPKSGEGLAETSFEVEAADAPREVPAPRASLFAQQAGNATRACRKGLPKGFVATAYVGPKGEVLSAGVAPPDESGEAASDCIVAALMSVRAAGLVASAEVPAKVSVRIP
jgi:hypothetical protein